VRDALPAAVGAGDEIRRMAIAARARAANETGALGESAGVAQHYRYLT
jgi:hypothetical protein